MEPEGIPEGEPRKSIESSQGPPSNQIEELMRIRSQVEYLEKYATKSAEDITSLLSNLRDSLNSMSALSLNYMTNYQDAIVGTSDAVNKSVVSAHTFVQKCVELNKDLSPLDGLVKNIHESKRLLTALERTVDKI